MTQPPAPAPGPLNGLRVVELCDEAGELAGKLLGDMGADVVKVEPPGGARTRGHEPFLERRAAPGAQPLLLALQHQQTLSHPRPR